MNGLTLIDVTDEDIAMVTQVMTNMAYSNRAQMRQMFDEGLLTSKDIMTELQSCGAGRKAGGLAAKIRQGLTTPDEVLRVTQLDV